MMVKWFNLFMMIGFIMLLNGTALSEEKTAPAKDPAVSERTATSMSPVTSKPLSETQKELYKGLQIWYDRSVEMGEKGRQWIQEDIENMGDWEYMVITLNPDDEERLTEQLNRLGKGRWEVFWVQEKMQGIRFYLKRPVRTYLKNIPVGDLLRAIPTGEGK